MNDPIQIFQTLAALLAIFAAAWLFLNSKRFARPSFTVLAATIGIACAGFLLCDIAISLAGSQAKLLPFLKASVGLAILVLGLLPWCLYHAYRRNLLPLLFAHGCFAGALLVVNYLSEFSLIHQSIEIDAASLRIEAKLSAKALLLLLLALSAFAYLCVSAMTAQRYGETLLSCAASLAALLLATSAALDGFAALSDEYTNSHAWIAIAGIGFCAITWRVAYKEKPKPDQSKAPPPPSRSAPTPPSEPSEESEPTETQALLLGLADGDADLTTKILSSQGCRVLRDESIQGIPTSHFTSPRSRHLILFERDERSPPPSDLVKLRSLENAQIRLIALARDPRSARIKQEIREGLFDEVLSSPPKAMELKRLVEGRNRSEPRRTRTKYVM